MLMKENLTFNDLPYALSEILSKISRLEEKLDAVPNPVYEDEVLNAQQAADLLHLALPTLYNKIAKREIPHIKKHKRLVFHRSELIEYLNEGRRGTASEQEQAISARVDNAFIKAQQSRKTRRK